ncbi:MAG: glutamate--tRNA ligase [Candidatus Calescibacterium sp.]|nr:glutamate--tRNA ligase [Candidatus Calescibacterium sp.]MCX7972418.1 glutamate--tRNA ligase [bacterium]MDW8195691.1 glutamate--tRNA ligase [Candidatus Calescibacterium sp.]
MVRTRFAPSPTGYLHIGGARTALFNYLFAKRNDGKFILRIEDTDLERSKIEYEKEIIQDLLWVGIRWDEGPDIGGNYGPYRQSERLELYNLELKKLVEKGLAYECYCTEEELEVQRKLQLKEKKPPIYDRRCLNLTEKKRKEYINEGRRPSYRFLVPHKTLEYTDLVHGKVTVDCSLISDPIIVKSNGIPTYNFACVVDDYHMGITHVIRGDEHLDNTPRQILIFEALGYKHPFYAHIPMILAPDRTKLSKRHGATSVKELKQLGYVPQALINYISLLGWSPKENREVFSIEEIIQRFDFDHILDHPAVYDLEKMKWFNHYYISNILTNQQVLKYLQELDNNVKNNIDLYGKIIEFEKSRVYSLLEFIDVFKIISNDIVDYDLSNVDANLFSLNIKNTYDDLVNIEFSSVDSIKQSLKRIIQKHNLRTQDLYKPIRFALTNTLEGIELPKLIYLLGKEKFLNRLKNFISFVDSKTKV